MPSDPLDFMTTFTVFAILKKYHNIDIRSYNSLIEPGSYLIVEDTNQNGPQSALLIWRDLIKRPSDLLPTDN